MQSRLFLIFCAFACCGESCALDAFYAGNSLTWSISPYEISGWAASRGEQHVYGYHIANGYNLARLAQYPERSDFWVSPYGAFAHAMPAYDWDVVTFAPFDVWDPWNSDAIVIPQLVNQVLANSANQSTQVYVFQSHPFLYYMTGITYTEKWDQLWNGSGYSPTIQTRDYYHQLMDQLQATETGLDKEILMIPVGEVMYELDKRMRAGEVPGFTSMRDLYANDGGIHLKANVGYFVVGTVFYATMFHDNPMGLAVPAWMQGAVTPEYAAIVQRLTWDVVAGHPHSGVAAEEPGDFNSDGTVDAADFAVWKSTYGSKVDLRADANLDLVVNAADYTIWRDHFVAEEGEPVPEAVPEPVGILLMLCGLVCGSLSLGRRR